MSLDAPIVDSPIDREIIRGVDEGHLVTCSGFRCQWQGLFPRRELAIDAINNHLARERRRGTHFGKVTAHLVKLLGDSRAHALTDSHHVFIGDSGPEDPLGFGPEEVWPGTGSGFTHEIDGKGASGVFPRTDGDLTEVVGTGDLIEVPPDRRGKVWRVRETRSLGLPTWTIEYVAPDREGWPDPETEWTRGQDQKWLNEMVVVDGTPVMRFTGQEYPVVGRAEEFQATMGDFSGGSVGS